MNIVDLLMALVGIEGLGLMACALAVRQQRAEVARLRAGVVKCTRGILAILARAEEVER